MAWPVLVFDIESIPDLAGLRSLRDDPPEWTDEQVYEAWVKERAEKGPRGPLHGIPLAVKDIICTKTMPTTCGSPIYRDYVAGRDAACVTQLVKAGAIVLGKSVTTEFAGAHAGKTHNPHDRRHTPGGSSSGGTTGTSGTTDPWSGGSYAAFGPGQVTRFWGLGQRPVGRIVLAGEHTSTRAQGYLEGAVESGERAASEALARL